MNYRQLVWNKIDSDKRWIILESLFNNYYMQQKDKSAKKIPKKIHQIWLGGELPEKYIRLQNTWKEIHPDWEYKLWTDKDVVDFDFITNKEIFNKIKNLGSKSDIFRYEILYKYGGIYADTDFECVKSFDDFIYLDFFSGNGHVINPEIFNGLIGCVPKHKIIHQCLKNIRYNETNDFNKIISNTGPQYFANIIFSNIVNNMVIFPTKFFYPFPAEKRFELRNESETSIRYSKSFNNEYTYAVHLWHTSWQK